METLFLALRVLVALGAILGLIWFVQRKVTGAGGKVAGGAKGGSKSAVAGRFGTSKKAIQVLGTHRLGAKASITVVEIDGVKMVLGVTENGISVLENAPAPQIHMPQVIAPATTAIAAPEAIDPESDRTQVAASAVDTLATADVREEPVDFAAVFREALDEAAETPVLATVTEEPEPAQHTAPRRRRRRVTIPALAEQLLPHMTRTLAGAIGIRVEPKPPVERETVERETYVPVEAAAASLRRVPLPQTGATGALAAFMKNAAPEPEKHAATRDYSNAQPLSAHLPVLQRAS